MYYNSCDAILENAGKEHNYDLTFLTDIDVAWEKDDLRDKKDDRKATFAVFEKALIDYKKPYIKLSGTKQE